MNIFRTATKQAIRDIIQDNASSGRYGVMLSDDNIEAIGERIVDLFEMTLNLRSQMSGGVSSQSSTGQSSPSRESSQANTQRRAPVARTTTLEHINRQQSSQQQKPESAGFPKTRWAAEIYDHHDARPTQHYAQAIDTELPPQIDYKLPRKRVALTAAEREKLGNK